VFHLVVAEIPSIIVSGWALLAAHCRLVDNGRLPAGVATA
jgi:hypothetical protein